MFYCKFDQIVLKYAYEVISLPDYKEMYYKLFRASEQAVRILISAQRECEKIYTSTPEPELRFIFPVSTEKKNDTDGK